MGKKTSTTARTMSDVNKTGRLVLVTKLVFMLGNLRIGSMYAIIAILYMIT